MIPEYRQVVCWATRQQAYRHVRRMSRAEVRERSQLRGLPLTVAEEAMRMALADRLGREMFLLDLTQMLLWTPAQIRVVLRRMNVEPVVEGDSVAMARWAALNVIRRKTEGTLQYQVSADRKLTLQQVGPAQGKVADHQNTV